MQSHSAVHCPETVEKAQVGLGVGLGVGLPSVRCGVGDGVTTLPTACLRCQPSGLCTAILHSCACSSAPQSTPRPRDCFQRWRGPSCSQTRHNRRIALLSPSRLPHTMSDRWKSTLRTAADRGRSTACCEAPSLARSRVEPHKTSFTHGVLCLNTYEKKFEQERLVVETLEDECEWRFKNACKMTTVNSKQMDMMSWEALFVQLGAVRDVYSFTQIPAKLISKIAATRDSIKNMLGPGPHTITQMQNKLRKHAPT